VINENYNGEIKITVIATGFASEAKKKPGHAQLMRKAFSSSSMPSDNQPKDDANDLDTPAFLRNKMR